ncbi:MAG: hypothetical protein O4805_05470 [Trichodesmium sp. St16_bin2-tuft]|nr:hypothetical protein [Trichodesmium sp. St16_bin2-tuft]
MYLSVLHAGSSECGFKVSLNAVGFEQWLVQDLLQSLKNLSVLLHG